VHWCRERERPLQDHIRLLEPLWGSGVVENSVGRECREGSDLFYSKYRVVIGKHVDA
jgi:hypothetical protein